MSTDARRSLREGRRRRQRGRFARALAIVLGALVVVGGAAAGIGSVQGPRATNVQADPASAIAASGSRVIITANQALAPIDPDQVSVEPATEFSVDAAGRTVGVRFPAALDAGTTYTVSVAGATGIGGGPASDLETTFTTPPADVFALVRDEAGPDRIVRRTIGADADPVVAFQADQLDDFRATSRYLVATTVEGDDMHVVAVDLAAGERAEIPLPGPGIVTGLQVSERGQLFGFTFTDRGLDESSGRENVLFTGSLADAFAGGAEPDPVVVAGKEPSIDRWRFVPETSSLLLNDFSGDLTLVNREDPDGEVSSFGTALSIEGVARSTYTALIDRLEEGFVALDLATGEQRALDPVDLDGETLLGSILPLPHGGTLRSYARLVDGIPSSADVVIADPGGDVREVATVEDGVVLEQVCASPSAQYVALTVSTGAGGGYDRGVQALPLDIETRIYDADSGDEVETWDGFDISWCEVGPW